ncbi:MAG: hypothetical protein GQ574_18420 [Crocinitomix sp.]|nr:hypothetical protein [Crocinitomix sp.]
MKALLLAILLFPIISSCGFQREHECDETQETNIITIDSSVVEPSSSASIKGKVVDDNGEPLFGTTVFLEKEGVKIGTSVNIDGSFEIKNVATGNYTLFAQHVGYQSVKQVNVEVQEGEQIILKDIILQSQNLELKPIIYFYPTDTITLDVHLDYEGEIIHTYPKSNGDWKMLAYPNGTLIDSTGRSFYSIYWEGITTYQKTINSGFIVDSEETIPFLEAKLAEIGLNEREANEFIIFWLPILNQNDRNLIHFDTEHYTKHAVLDIQPAPETLIRIMMLHCPIESEIKIIEQTLPISPERKGFTVVEWGGKKISLTQLESQ